MTRCRVDSSSDQQRVIANAQDSTTNCSDEDYSFWSVGEMKRHDFSSETYVASDRERL